jgi:hypothetical protein
VKQRFCRAAVLVAAMLACSAGTAHAGLISWLDQLSGPGRFWIFDGSYGIRCRPLGKSSRDGGASPAEGDAGAKTPADTNILSGITGGCQSRESLDKRIAIWSAGAGLGFTVKNPLVYDDHQTHSVFVTRAATSIDFRVHRTLDVGLGGGVIDFYVHHQANFARPYIEPLRIGFRPLVNWKGPIRHPRRGALVVYANWNIILGDITGDDFGAPSDPFHVRNELKRFEFGLNIDVKRLRDK